VARELENVVIQLVRRRYRSRELATPDRLQCPRWAAAGRRWRVLERVYRELTAMELPDVMQPRERRKVD
jgi:predicted translin family RNA/ssDNA-binding protein